MALGSSPNAFSLGEIIRLSGEIKENTPCVCGAKIQKCPFWQAVNECMKIRYGDNFIENPNSLQIEYDGRHSKLKKASMILGLSKKEPFGLNTKKLYDAILEQSKVEILIDSSKDFLRALILRHYLSDYRIAFIHLIRDVRGYVHSMKKTTYTVKFPGEEKALTFPRPHMQVDESVKMWKYGNIKISFYLRFLGLINSARLVRYEELTEKPFKVLKTLADWLGLSNLNQMIHFGSVVHHNVHGNPSRFNSNKINPSSKRWKKELNKEELDHIKKRAGLLNRIYGFRN